MHISTRGWEASEHTRLARTLARDMRFCHIEANYRIAQWYTDTYDNARHTFGSSCEN